MANPIRPVNTTDTPLYDQTGNTAGAVDSGYYDATKFVPELYSKKVLRNFYETTFWQQVMNTDYEGEIKGQGAKVHIRKTPEITVSAYSIGTKLDYQVPTKDATELLIDQGIYSAFQVDDVNKAQADIELVNMFAKDAAQRIAIAVDQEVFEFMSDGAAATNKGANAGAISTNIDLGLLAGVGTTLEVATDSGTGFVGAIDLIVDINQVLDEANQPSEGRYIILPAWYCALLKKGDLKAADITGDSTGVIRNGMIGMVDRTVIYQSNNLYTATDGDTETAWFIQAGTKEAATFASQVDKVDTLKIPDSFGEYWRTLFVYGRAVVQPTALVNAVVKKYVA